MQKSFYFERRKKVMKKLFCLTCTILFAALLLTSVPFFAVDKDAPKEVFTGSVVGVGGLPAGQSISFTLEISGATSDEDTLKYLEVLKNKGQEGLLSAISKNKFGWFKLDSTRVRGLNITKWTYDLLVVRALKTEKGRLFKILFERTPSMYELRQGGRIRDYIFTYMEIYMGDDGKGNVMAIGAAKIKWNKKEELEIEGFGTYPARLMGVLKR
jgi:hypothetical protein